MTCPRCETLLPTDATRCVICQLQRSEFFDLSVRDRLRDVAARREQQRRDRRRVDWATGALVAAFSLAAYCQGSTGNTDGRNAFIFTSLVFLFVWVFAKTLR
jgi:hypothetical protein